MVCIWIKPQSFTELESILEEETSGSFASGVLPMDRASGVFTLTSVRSDVWAQSTVTVIVSHRGPAVVSAERREFLVFKF